jgi:hypothetical protein
MPDMVEVELSNLDTPRSPVSISPESSRRGSLKPIHPEKNSEPPTPNSPYIRLTRKRAASLTTESSDHPRIADLALNGASTGGTPTSDPIREQVCLCQPDPKIPRPLNGARPTSPFMTLDFIGVWKNLHQRDSLYPHHRFFDEN